MQGQDAEIIVRTYSNGEGNSFNVVIFRRANDRHAYEGKIAWPDGYRRSVSKAFDLPESQ